MVSVSPSMAKAAGGFDEGDPDRLGVHPDHPR
jgi:hypothetical protein